MATSLRPWRAELVASGLFGTDRPSILAGDRARASALLVGCAIGLALSWHTVLSPGARDRFVVALAELAAGPNTTLGADRPRLEHEDLFIPGMKPGAGRQPEEAFVWPRDPSVFPVEEASPPPEPVVEAMVSQLPVPEGHATPEPQPVEAAAPAQAMEVTFQLNSSYLPAGAADELSRFVDRLPPHGRVALELRSTVSDDGVKDADSTEARRYNRWLAERRLARVEEILQRRGAGRITVHSSLVEHDSSRRVLLSERPKP